MIFTIGDLVRIPIDTFADEAMTDPADPDGISLAIQPPTGGPVTVAWPGDITRRASTTTGDGAFDYLVDASAGGFWSALATTTGAVTTSEPYSWYVAAEPPYLLPQDIRGVLAGVATLPGTAAALTDGDLFDAIFEAQTEVNARLADRYTVPFVDVPPLVINITRDIAAYVATLTYRRGDPIQTGEPVLLRYQRAQTLLAQAAAGNLALPVADGTTPGNVDNLSTVAVSNPVDGDLWTASDFDLQTAPSAGWSGPRWR